jgi:hypothetical protein
MQKQFNTGSNIMKKAAEVGRLKFRNAVGRVQTKTLDSDSQTFS